MKVLLRKVKGEGVALLCAVQRAWATPGRCPSLLQTLGVFVLVLLPVLAALALTALALHVGGHDATYALAVAPILELRAKHQKLVTDANTALKAAQAKAKAENRPLTAEELTADDAFQAQIEAVLQEIKIEERRLERERQLGSSAPSGDRRVPGSGPQRRAAVENVRDRADEDPRHGFSNHREFLQAVASSRGVRTREDVRDERLRSLAVFDENDEMAAEELAFMLPVGFTPRSLHATAGSDEQGAYSDQYGGFATMTSRLPGMLALGFEGDPTAGRTQDVPMQTNSVEILARTDKDHTTSVSGGFTVARKAETAAASASRGKIEMVTLKAASLFGFGYATEEILADSLMSFIAIIDAGFRDQFGAHMLNEKIRGNGGNEFIGVLSDSNPSLVTVTAENAQSVDTIVTANVLKMRARSWGYGNAIWIANHDTFPQLATLSIGIGAAGVLVYQQSLVEDRPDTMLGRPIFYSEYAAKLGDKGDLMLLNMSQYLEGLYQPLQSAESVHVRFDRHERAFKFWLRNAGAPWWRAALTPNMSSDTLSPFVTLAAR